MFVSRAGATTGNRGRRWHHGAAKAMVLVLGAVFMISSAFKATDMGLFAQQIKAYGLLSENTPASIVAWVMVALEWALGVGLALFFRPRVMLSLATVLLAGFAALTTWAWANGVVEDCGCFGPWLKHSPGEKAVENLLMLLLAVFSWRVLGSQAAEKGRWDRTKPWAAALSCCLLLLFAGLWGGTKAKGIGSSATAAAPLEDVQIEGLEYLDLRFGTYLVALIGTDCEHCQDAVSELNLLAQGLDMVTVIALCPNETEKRIDFVERFQPLFPLGGIPQQVFWRLLDTGGTPRILLVNNGLIERAWDGAVPSKEEIGIS